MLTEQTVGVFNDHARELLDLPAELMREGLPFDEVLEHQRKHDGLADRAEDMRALEQKNFLLYQRKRPNGTVLEIRSVLMPGGGVVRTYTDITQRWLAEERAVHAARHDFLTSLPNRATFADRLADAIVNAERTDTRVVALFLDLDRFKQVNDTLGHAAGDELLRQVAGRMRSVVRDCDTLARIGGDEFALVMPGMLGPEAALVTAERLRSVVSEPYSLSQGTGRIGVSIGISCRPIHGHNADELLSRADLALYRAKMRGRDKCCLFDAHLDSGRQSDLVLEGESRLALREEQFELAYQPVLDVRTRRIVGAEALLRWRHPAKGMIPPLSFIPLAERARLIVELGRWVLETACREALNWATPISVSVNVAPAQLSRREIVAEVRDLLGATGLPPAWP